MARRQKSLVQQLMKPISKAVTTAAVNQGLDLDGVKAGVLDKVNDKVSEGFERANGQVLSASGSGERTVRSTGSHGSDHDKSC